MRKFLAAAFIIYVLTVSTLADGGVDQSGNPCGGTGQSACASIPDDVSFVDEMVEVLSFILPTF